MATGRRDYTWGFLSEAAVEGRYVDEYLYNYDLVAISGVSTPIWDYTVPDNCSLLVNHIDIDVDKVCSGIANLFVNDVQVYERFFDEFARFDFSDVNPLKLDTGDHIYMLIGVTCYTNPNVVITVVGNLIQLTS